MKLLISYIFILNVLFVSCIEGNTKSKETKNLQTSVESSQGLDYRVAKIDLIDSVYAIYLSGGGADFLVLSAKDSKEKDCETIKIWGSYNLNLKPFFDNEDSTSVEINAIVYNGMEFYYGDFPAVDFYTAENLKGLCLVKNKK